MATLERKIVDLRDVAVAIFNLSYVDMTEMADMLISSVASDREEGSKFDPENRAEWCERLRWWAESYIDAQEGE